MSAETASIDRQTWDRLVRVARNLATSPVGKTALGLFSVLLLLLVGVNGLNVVNSYVGRDFMTAIENRKTGEFLIQATLYVGVFALSTLVAVFYRFTEERLGLLWREWLTRHLLDRYLEHPIYYRLNDRFSANGEVLNVDQRIAEDAKVFTTTTLSFVLMLLNGALTVVVFSGVMWSISPLLFGVAVLYSLLGSYLAVVLGRSLVGLNYAQLDKEATFRSDLVQVRENAESIAVQRREAQIEDRVLSHFGDLRVNFGEIIRVNRNLGFFTTSYNYLIQIIPVLIVAPMFMRGEVEFGVITQSAMAFAHLLGAFSLVVTQFQSISSFAAVIARLGSLMEGMEQAQAARLCAIEMRGGNARLGYEKLTLRVPDNGHVVIESLSVSIPAGLRVLVVGAKEPAGVALFRATAGLWEAGSGCVIRPDLDQLMFLPERPYLPPGTLRELLQTGRESVVPDGGVEAGLTALHLEPVVERVGGLDAEQDWDSVLSLSEQQRFAFARLLIAAPRFVLLDRLSSALDSEPVGRLLDLLRERSIGYLYFGEPGEQPSRHYDAVLELAGDGPWQWRPLTAESADRPGTSF